MISWLGCYLLKRRSRSVDETEDSVLEILIFEAPHRMGFPDRISGREPTSQCQRHRRTQVQSLGRKIPWRRTWQPTPVFLSRESHGQRSLAGYSPWGLNELGTTEATDHIGCTGKVANRCLDIWTWNSEERSWLKILFGTPQYTRVTKT